MQKITKSWQVAEPQTSLQQLVGSEEGVKDRWGTAWAIKSSRDCLPGARQNRSLQDSSDGCDCSWRK